MFRNPEFGGREIDDSEIAEESEVEEVISTVHQEILNDIDLTPSGSNLLNEIFDAARRNYNDPEVQKEWDILFADLVPALTAAEDEDEVEDVLHTYGKKARALTQ